MRLLARTQLLCAASVRCRLQISAYLDSTAYTYDSHYHEFQGTELK
jgi:hypothetical protein